MLDVCTTIAHSPASGRIAAGGSNSVRIIDTSGSAFLEHKADAIDLEPSQVWLAPAVLCRASCMRRSLPGLPFVIWAVWGSCCWEFEYAWHPLPALGTQSERAWCKLEAFRATV